MYHFNRKLIDRLPSLAGMTKVDFSRMCGASYRTYLKWTEGKMSCMALVSVCNRCRISLSSFLVLKENPEVSDVASDYIIPEELWKPVEWCHETAGQLFGTGGLTGITKSEAARKLGFGSYQIFDYWGKTPTALGVIDLLNLLNTFQIDASLFFRDPNSVIPLPAWEVGNKHIADIVAERMEGYRDLERKLAEKDREIRSLRTERDRLTRQNLLLQEKSKEAAKSSPLAFRGYSFHSDLWERLPEMFAMERKDFCDAVGVNYYSFLSVKNIQVGALLKACNMLRISVSHFFVPKGETAAVHDKGYYAMSPRLFSPIESRLDRLKYLFGRYGATGFTRDDCAKASVGDKGLRTMISHGEDSRVFTVCDICSSFNIPPYIFFSDENRKKAVYAESVNERLLLNSIEMMKEVESLRAEVKRLKEG